MSGTFTFVTVGFPRILRVLIKQRNCVRPNVCFPPIANIRASSALALAVVLKLAFTHKKRPFGSVSVDRRVCVERIARLNAPTG